jgi:hypothetical protein
MPRLRLTLQAAAELGLEQLALYGIYRLGLKTGHYKRLTRPRRQSLSSADPGWSLRTDLLPLPDRQKLQALISTDLLFAEADEILSGKVRLFGGQPVPLVLTAAGPLQHWSEGPEGSQDIKPVWEMARFGWAVTLARAYHLSGNEDYPRAFWQVTQAFIEANPANQGPHWASAQEVALRLIALVFAIQIFSPSSESTPSRMALLSQSIAEHAARIPPTLVYARAQNNNHLISEAAGLYTAAATLPSHPQAGQWKRLGEKWLNHAFQRQIAPDGAYTQHSTNYHRLMLQAALWVFTIQRSCFPDQPFPPATLERLAAASRWLVELLDPISGSVPNLGPNDGAYILPLSTCPFNDFRPVLASAGAAFLQEKPLAPGPWDEMASWFGLESDSLLPGQAAQTSHLQVSSPHTIRQGNAWAYLRAAEFHSRPGHADQLHLDLWWRGLNIAQDPGTYLYTAPHPWDNALTHTAVHNTLTIDGLEQMRRVGRFLYLDWAQAGPPIYEHAGDGSWQRLSVHHNGYRRLGMVHQRSVTVDNQENWLIDDIVSGPPDDKVHEVRLHWLVPDWDYQIGVHSKDFGTTLLLDSPYGQISLKLSWIDSPAQAPSDAFAWGLARTGGLLAGLGRVHPTWGWTSLTYGDKIPALAFFMTVSARLPIHIQSQWNFP